MNKIVENIKNYFEYRRNIRVVKRELAGIGAVALPAVRDVSEKGADIVNFAIRLVKSAGSMDGEKLVEMVLNELGALLNTDYNRIMEILTYMASLQPGDIQKIISHSMVETMPHDN